MTDPSLIEERSELSLVLPCYNEEDTILKTIPALATAFTDAGIGLQIIAVDNGSQDRTGELLDQLLLENYPIEKVKVETNIGYGNGILQGLKHVRADYVGFMCADGHVLPEDVLALYRICRNAERPTLAKARRKFRPDGWKRKFVSTAYNVIICSSFLGLNSFDINGNPKIMPTEILRRMELQSKNWFLDPETMIKAKFMRLPVEEINIHGRPRAVTRSNVHIGTCFEFTACILWYILGFPLKDWKQRIRNTQHEQDG